MKVVFFFALLAISAHASCGRSYCLYESGWGTMTGQASDGTRVKFNWSNESGSSGTRRLDNVTEDAPTCVGTSDNRPNTDLVELDPARGYSTGIFKVNKGSPLGEYDPFATELNDNTGYYPAVLMSGLGINVEYDVTYTYASDQDTLTGKRSVEEFFESEEEWAAHVAKRELEDDEVPTELDPPIILPAEKRETSAIDERATMCLIPGDYIRSVYERLHKQNHLDDQNPQDIGYSFDRKIFSYYSSRTYSLSAAWAAMGTYLKRAAASQQGNTCFEIVQNHKSLGDFRKGTYIKVAPNGSYQFMYNGQNVNDYTWVESGTRMQYCKITSRGETCYNQSTACPNRGYAYTAYNTGHVLAC